MSMWSQFPLFLFLCFCPSSILRTWLSESLELKANRNWCKESFCYTRPHPIKNRLIALMHDYVRQANFNPKPCLKENFLRLHSLCVGILFKFTTSGILLCKTSQLNNFKTRLGGEICSFDVNTRKGYFLGTPPIIICTCTAVYSHEAHFHMLIPCDLF